MNIKYKYIEHERTEDAPFVGALICAEDCTFNCPECFNQELRKNVPNIIQDSGHIISLVKQNPLNQGVIFGGLEWSRQPMEMIELAEKARLANLEVMIYTGLEKDEFFRKVGMACVRHSPEATEIENNIVTKEDETIYNFIGAMVMDNLVGDYYLKCGRYDNSQKTTDKVQFGVSLSSENQVIYKFKKVEEE